MFGLDQRQYGVVGAGNTNDAEGAAYIFTDPAPRGPRARLPRSRYEVPRTLPGFGTRSRSAATRSCVGTPGGPAYVFTESGSAWPRPERHSQLPDGAANAGFGSVSINGNTIVVAAPLATVLQQPALMSTKVRPLSSPSPAPRGPTNPTAMLTATDGTANARFADSVSISGNTVVIGAPGATDRHHRQPGGGLYVHRSSAPIGPSPLSLTRPMANMNDSVRQFSLDHRQYVRGRGAGLQRSAQQRPGCGLCRALARATVTGLSPASGRAAGGTTVTITGTGFSRRDGGRLWDNTGKSVSSSTRTRRSRPRVRPAPVRST